MYRRAARRGTAAPSRPGVITDDLEQIKEGHKRRRYIVVIYGHVLHCMTTAYFADKRKRWSSDGKS